MHNTDYLIIGAGSAGCVLANRLSADPANQVTLIEAGGSDLSLWVRMPIGYGGAFYHPRLNWQFTTQPVPGLQGRTSYWPRGKVLGGSSAINAMVFVRGQRQDFDGWEAAGNPGWGFDALLPHFRAIEDAPDGDPTYRGRGGGISVSRTDASVHPLSKEYLNAAQAAGLPLNPDYNGADQEGVALYQITTRKGLRSSSATGFLHPVRGRSNLRLITHALAARLLFQGRRCIGLEYLRHGKVQRIIARREVIVSAGAIGSPALLERSGIGDPVVLGDLGIPVQQALTGVGNNLMDHLGLDHFHKARVPTLNDELGPLWPRAKAALRYALTRRGPLSLSANQAGGFFRSDPGRTRPNLQLYFTPVSYTKAKPGKRRLTAPDPFSGLMIGLSNCHPLSRGSLHIHSSDPAAPPVIQPNYLSAPEDLAELVQGVGMLRRIMAQPPLAELMQREVVPGVNVTAHDAIAQDIRARAWSVFHPCGTCQMGPQDDPGAVVDARLRVHGVAGLRVADASIFPAITAGNINAPTLMVADKAATMILEDATRGQPANT